jgi:carbamoyltransferase
MPLWVKEKLFTRRTLRRELPGFKGPLVFPDHHESHAASAFYPSPFEDAAILTLDGVGEWSTTATGVGEGNRIELTRHIRFPHSLGLLYSAFTYYCGFRINSGEYKLMGLAPYGEPRFADAIYQNLIDVKPDGSFRLDMRYFNYCEDLTMTNRRFDALFGGPPRSPESDLQQRHMDLAASIQVVTEDVVLRLGRDLHRQTGKRNLVLAGGVALNCVANGRLLREGPFDNLWIQPAAGDAGGALGAAWLVWHQLLNRPRQPDPHDRQRGSFLGPSYSSAEIQDWLREGAANFQHFPTQEDLVEQVVHLLEQEKVVGWFQGRMEFGPRALGGRTILGDPRSPRMQATMNLKIKFRESFRPFAPCVLAEQASKWFDIKPNQESPYMMLVAPVRDEHRTALDASGQQIMQTDLDLRRRVNLLRSTIPAVTHVDYSARFQTVDATRNSRLHALLEGFYRQTGCPILVNTSFNVRGEPIVCTPQDAYRCFLATDMDALVLEDCIVTKADIVRELSESEKEVHRAQFQAD